MQVLGAALPAARFPSDWTRRAITFLCCALATLLIGWGSSQKVFVRTTLAFTLVLLLVSVGLKMPRALIIGTLGWLVVLGLVRRLLTPLADAGASDPLLIVAPVTVLVLVLISGRHGSLAAPSRLTKAVLLLNVLTVVSVANPSQGGIMVGLGGLLFVLVPVIWFWIGRSLLDRRAIRTVLVLVAVLGVLSALYGMYQTFGHLPSFDRAWAESKGPEYQAILVNGTIRPFGPFTSASDYGLYLSAAGMVLLGATVRSRLAVLTLAALVLVLVAIVVSGSRGPVVTFLLATGIVLAARWRLGLSKGVIVGAALVAVIGILVSRVEPASLSGGGASPFVARQVTGLSNPFDQNGGSTVGVHLSLVILGIRSMVHFPLGRGVGVTTIAGGKFGGSAFGTETDPSNAAVALGLPGFLTYLVIVALAVSLAYRRAHEEGDVVSIAILGILVITGLQWLNGGNYAAAPLVWLVIGWLDRPSARKAPAPGPEGREPALAAA